MTDESMLWSGRFGAPPSSDLIRLTASIGFDLRLLPQDLKSTKAHARALVSAGLLERDDLDAIDSACDEILSAHRSGELIPQEGDEDVHSLVERELTERLGETGRRIHAGRSRNDLIASDLRLWCKEAARDLRARTGELIDALADISLANRDTVLPGYTHVQRAQPVLLPFHLMAHAFALLRDGDRFSAADRAADSSTLGAGALAGTTLPLDPAIPARELQMERVFYNAMDAVSDRDFACDLVYACSLCSVHLSRLAEEIVLWTSSEFGFATLSDEWSSGSSMMPQKRNPDAAELTRGRSAATIGDLTAMLALLKGLPLAYNRDLQEDKPLVFSAVDRTAQCLESMTHLCTSLEFHPTTMEAAAASGATWATDLAETLVQRGVPFRDAHRATGELVAYLEAGDTELPAVGEDDLRAHHPAFHGEDVALADPHASVAARHSPGGTSPEMVTKQIQMAKRKAATFARR